MEENGHFQLNTKNRKKILYQKASNKMAEINTNARIFPTGVNGVYLFPRTAIIFTII